MDQAQIDKHKADKKEYWQCGFDSHRAIHCKSRKDTEGNSLPPATADQPQTMAGGSGRKAVAGVKQKTPALIEAGPAGGEEPPEKQVGTTESSSAMTLHNITHTFDNHLPATGGPGLYPDPPGWHC